MIEKGTIECFEGFVEYMKSLGYEDPRDKRIAELEAAFIEYSEFSDTLLADKKRLKAQIKILEAKNQALRDDKASQYVQYRHDLDELEAELKAWKKGHGIDEMLELSVKALSKAQAKLDRVRAAKHKYETFNGYGRHDFVDDVLSALGDEDDA